MKLEDFMNAKELVDEYRRLTALRHEVSEMRKWGYLRMGDIRMDGDLQVAICDTLDEHYRHGITRVTNELYKLGVEV